MVNKDLYLHEYRNGIKEQERINSIMKIMPKGRLSVLDIGARDGYLSGLLTAIYSDVFALDLEKPRFEIPNVTTLQGDVTKLDIPDDEFDVVLCAEVLEHIPPKNLQKACNEIARIAKHEVVIGVPFDQDIRVGRTTCTKCGKKNPPWGHVNIFSERKLINLFKCLSHVETYYVGKNKERTNAISTFLMDIGGNPFGSYTQEESCIKCGEQLVKPLKRNIIQKIFSTLAVWLNKLQSLLVRPRPIWVHIVFEK